MKTNDVDPLEQALDEIIVGYVEGDVHVVHREALSSEQHRNREALLDKVQNFWVKGVLENSLHNAALIELGKEYRPETIDHPWGMVLQLSDERRTLPQDTQIIDVFTDMGGELLILGAPGSGKTTMLLELARHLLARAKEDAAYPMPVVFNLSPWANKRKPLTEWLVDELNAQYQVPRKIGGIWIAADQIIPLLDGLDEVEAEARDACVEAINAFRSEHTVDVVVCSRIKEHEALTTRFKLQGAIALQPLTPQQVEAYLEGVGDDLLAVRQTLRHDATLRELTESPLTLSIMTLAYRGMERETLLQLDTQEARRQHLFETYTEKMLARQPRRVEKACADEETRRYLIWLAARMQERDQPIFSIERMQPGLLSEPVSKRQYTKSIRLTVGVLVGLGFGIVVWLIFGITAFGLMGKLTPAPTVTQIGVISMIRGITGLFFLFGSGLIWAWNVPTDRIALYEALRWPRNEFRKLLGKKWTGWLMVWLSGSAAFGLPLGIVFVLRDGWAVGLAVGTVGALGVGFASSLVVMLAIGMTSGFSSTVVDKRNVPNQGIMRSLRNAALVGVVRGLIFGLASGIYIAFVGEYRDGIGVFIIILVAFILTGGGFHYGGETAIGHLILRLILYRAGRIPANYARFLDYAAERLFLRKVGGGYIFIHRLLLEYFASLEDEST